MTIDERLDLLERSNKRWRLATVVIGVLFVLHVAAHIAWRNKFGTLDAGMVRIQSDDGKRYVNILSDAIFLQGSNGEHVSIGPSFSSFGKVELWNGASGIEPSIKIHNKDSKPAILLRVPPETDGGSVEVFNQLGFRVASLQSSLTNQGVASVYDVSGVTGKSLSP